MKKIRKILTAFLAGITAVSISSGTLNCFAEGVLYDQELTKDAIDLYYIIGLEADPLARYPQAKENGVREFILTEEGKEVYNGIMAEHQQVKDEIAGLIGRTPEVNYDYTAAFNGFSMALSDNEKEIVKNNIQKLGITSIEDGAYVVSSGLKSEAKESESFTSVSSSVSYSDLTERILEESGITESSLNGDGIVIAVIDTEFDSKHEFLTMPEGVKGKFSKEDVKAVYPYLSAAPYVSEKCYVNEKIPYAFDYVGYDFNTFSMDSSHGTHVAGIAAGNGDSETDINYEPDGVASNAQLVLMSAETLGASMLMAAYDDVLYLGADIVNASYGASYVVTHNSYSEYTAINNIVSTGTVFCNAAGNSAKNSSLSDIFTDYSTSGAPTNVDGNFAVGSADNPVQEKNNNIIKLADGSEEIILDAERCHISELMNGLELEYTVVPGMGETSDYANIDVKNKIALVQRGTISFTEKINNAYEAGAIGVIIYNNDSELLIMVDDGVLIPSGMVSYETGMKMIEAETKTVTFQGNAYTIEQNKDIIMSDYSSWAFTEQLILSPDISGFGGNILSSVPDNNHKSYAFNSGTSMAAPQLTGINALLKEYLLQNQEKYGITNRSDYTELSAKLLMSTATPVYTNDNLEIASPRVQGNGIANLSYAINTPCYISTDSEKDNYRPKLSLGDGYKQSYDLVFNVTNLSDAECIYTPSVQFFRDTENEDNTLAWNTLRLSEYEDFTAVFSDETGKKLEQIKVPAGKTVKITAKVTMSDEVYNDIKEKKGRFVDGFVRLNSTENPNLTVSFMAFCGDWSQAEEGGIAYRFIYNEMAYEGAALMDYNQNIAGLNMADASVTQPYYSPNGDNVFDSLKLFMFFKRRCYDLTATIYNSDGKQVYTQNIGNGYNRELDDLSIEGRAYNIKWDFKENGEIKENAEYTIEISARLPLAEEMTVIDSCTFKIDNKKPTIKKVGKLKIDNSEYLIIDAEDNSALQAALIYSDLKSEVVDLQSANYSVSGKKIIVNITECMLNDVVEIYDIAGNMTTVSINDATYTLYAQMTENFGFATTDEESFTDGKISITDENGKEAQLDIDLGITPTLVYEANGNEVTESCVFIDGFETVHTDLTVGIMGDSNQDGNFNVRDVAYTARMLSSKSEEGFTEFVLSLAGYCADCDKNGEVTVRDAALAARMLATENL
ncbi:MAG: hypothetical protein E7508_03815 [Ruminococcus sp.]|nr:hypothetical protein [Ruminococcus sp.]